MKTCTITTVLALALASANGQVDQIPSCAAACGGPNLPSESVCQHLNFLRETSTFSSSHCARNCEDYDYFAIFDLYDRLECQSELSPGRAGCSNICDHAYDGDCDDGGAGSEYNLCDWGTDCNDCGRREPEPMNTLQASAGTNQTESGFLKARKAKKVAHAKDLSPVASVQDLGPAALSAGYYLTNPGNRCPSDHQIISRDRCKAASQAYGSNFDTRDCTANWCVGGCNFVVDGNDFQFDPVLSYEGEGGDLVRQVCYTGSQ